MPTCTFFGHRDCPDSVLPQLRNTLERLIIDYGVDMFYVGNQGQYDALVRKELRSLSEKYPKIHYAVVLAYMPGEKECGESFADTMLPEGIESVHPKYAISWRNRWMLAHADFVIAYVTHSWGGAARYVKSAITQHKQVLNLGADLVCGETDQ